MTWRRPSQGGGDGTGGAGEGALGGFVARVSTQGPVADLANAAPLNVDGVNVEDGWLVFVNNQAAPAENGLYVVDSAGTGADGQWSRSPYFETAEQMERTGLVYVQQGANDHDTLWQLTTDPPITVGVTAINFQLRPLAAAAAVNPVLTWGAGQVGSSTTTRYLYPGYDDALAQTAVVQWLVPRPGTLSAFYMRHNIPRGNGTNVVYTVRVNGAPTALSVALASTATDGNDLANLVAVAAGDLVDVEVTKAAVVASSPRDIMGSLLFTG